MNALTRLCRHLWLDADDARRTLGDAAITHLEQRIRDSEDRHLGEICICVEASLPLADVWRVVLGAESVDAAVHQRALALFGELRVWDTELNNGVLIYVQLAEHRIEIVADRGLAARTRCASWQQALDEAGEDFRAGRYEAGLQRAVDVVGGALEACFPASGGDQEGRPAERDQLPNRPTFR